MIKFYSKRYIFIGISLAIMLAGVVAMVVNGVDLDVEFKGGTLITYEMTGQVDLNAIDSKATELSGVAARSQITTNNATKQQLLVITLADVGVVAQKQDELTTALQSQNPDANLKLYETSVVKPFIGKKFLQNGITAIILAFIMIALYVWYSFRNIGGLSAGIMALVALIHDCIIVFFIFVFFKIPLNEYFVTAVLTIIGFSVNDTIVIYDRIRENVRMSKRIDYEELVDRSINQSLTRSINTNLAVFVSIAIVCVFAYINGLSSILSFALPMTFGVVSGCYSTICIAGPLWAMWKNRNTAVAK